MPSVMKCATCVPAILGHDVAGEVVKVGSRVRQFKAGDEVYARADDLRIGTFAELVPVREASLAPKPQALTMEEAASVPLVALTAAAAVTTRVRLVTMVAIGNAPAYGSGLRITPRALFDDGKLDVCFVRALSKPQLLRFFPKVFRGSHVELEQVEYLQAADIRIETDVPMRINCDGEHGGHTPAVFTVLPKALRVIVP